MADGILSIATVIMAGAIKQISVEHGLDPRDFVLFCYGGGGPLHATALARELSIPTVVIPPEPGNFSAIGMLLADARLDLSKTFVGVLERRDGRALNERIRRDGGGGARRAGARIRRRRGALRAPRRDALRGQRHNIKVPISGLAEPSPPSASDFDRDYKRRYGHADRSARPSSRRCICRPSPGCAGPSCAPAARRQPARRRRTRGRSISARRRHVEAQVYDRAALPPAFAAAGPAVIEEYGSTTLVWPGDRFEIGRSARNPHRLRRS